MVKRNCNNSIGKPAAFFVIILCSLFLFKSPLFAQKIKVIKNKKRNYPERTVTIDTLNVEIKIQQLGFKELHYYSIAFYSDLPPDLSVLISPSAFNKKKNSKDNIFVFYHLKQSDYLSLNNLFNFYNSYSNIFYINPFLNSNGQKRYYVFLLEIRNNNFRRIFLNPDLIKAKTQNYIYKSIITLDDFKERNKGDENLIEKEKTENILKILADNLFKEEFISPGRMVNGLICFPISRFNEKIIEINIPDVEIHQKQKIYLNIKL